MKTRKLGLKIYHSLRGSVVGRIYYRIKLPLSIFKTFLLQNNFLSVLANIFSLPSDNNYLTDNNTIKSASDNGKYPEIALEAALDPKKFSVFRRHHLYVPILEGVRIDKAQEYFQIIHEEYKLSIKEILEAIAPLQSVGTPRLYSIKGLPKPVSTSSLRYLKIALDIRALKGESFGHIVEIGCGFGGQAIILDKIGKIDSYTFIDLWQVNMLIKRFIENSEFSSKYITSTISDAQPRRDSWDLLISNYAFSELPINLQQKCMNDIILKSNYGYMIMNSREEGGWGNREVLIRNMTKKDLISSIPNCSSSEERPSTNPRNYILSWKMI